MAEFTLLKLQLDDASFAANAPFSGDSDAEAEPAESDDEEESGSVLPLLIGLVFLVAVAAIARKVLGGSSEPPAVEADVDEA